MATYDEALRAQRRQLRMRRANIVPDALPGARLESETEAYFPSLRLESETQGGPTPTVTRAAAALTDDAIFVAAQAWLGDEAGPPSLRDIRAMGAASVASLIAIAAGFDVRSGLESVAAAEISMRLGGG